MLLGLNRLDHDPLDDVGDKGGATVRKFWKGERRDQPGEIESRPLLWRFRRSKYPELLRESLDNGTEDGVGSKL